MDTTTRQYTAVTLSLSKGDKLSMTTGELQPVNIPLSP
jgi:hypothetical protein